MNAGIYNGQFKKAVTMESGTKKTPTLALTFDVTHVSDGADWAEIPQVERTVFLYLSDAALPHSEEKLKRLEFNGDFNSPDIGVKQVALELKYEEYNGKQKERWELAGGGKFEPEPASDGTIRRLNALWKNNNKPQTKPAGKPPAPPKKEAEPVAAGAEGGKEIPF